MTNKKRNTIPESKLGILPEYKTYVLPLSNSKGYTYYFILMRVNTVENIQDREKRYIGIFRAYTPLKTQIHRRYEISEEIANTFAEMNGKTLADL